MKAMLDEFKKFIFKGNVIDLSTGVIIGAAFGSIVRAFTDGIITPILTKIGGAEVGLKLGIFDIGLILSSIINFVITAAVIFFIIVKPANALMARLEKEEEAAPTPEEIQLLREIRDALKK